MWDTPPRLGMLLLLGCALFSPDPGLTPAERLDRALPGLAAAAGAYTEGLGPVADLVDAADPALVRLLLPRSEGLRSDRVGESPEVDLLAARVELDGTRLVGRIEGSGAPHVLVDVRDGPAPDLRVGLREDGVWIEEMDGWTFSPARRVPGEVTRRDGGVEFDVDLAGWAERGHVGAALAAERAGEVWDYGPAGVLGEPEPHAVALLVGLLGQAADADLTLAVALAYAPWRAHVADTAAVLADARARLRYGVDLDPWLARHEAAWRLGDQPPLNKLLWAWPGGEAVVYGALPLAWAEAPLSPEAWRFHVPSVAALTTLRDDLPFDPDPQVAADARDVAIWEDMTYRAADAGMAALCKDKRLPSATCFSWKQDHNAGRTLGPVDGRPIPMHLGTSVELQLDRLAEDGSTVGDCSTATTLALAAYQAIGLAPLGVGYAGPSWYWPTHNFPLWSAGDRLRSPQGMPDHRWDADTTWAYAVLPVVDPYAGVALGWEPDGWARGGSVAGGALSYGELGRWVDEGVELADVAAWIEDGATGGWPEFR